MKVLYDCFSCSPYYGSDEEIGWMWPFLMRKYHSVWVLVRKDRKSDIEKYCSENQIDDIHFIYCDLPSSLNIYYYNKRRKKNGTIDFLFYQFLWQFIAIKTAKKLNEEIGFDIVHHVCTNDFRLLGYMYKLDIPLIIGPIGGAQDVPLELQEYVQNYWKKEKIRLIINRLMISVPGYRKALNKADRIFFSNRETLDYLSPYIKNMGKCELLAEVGTNNTQHVPENKSQKCTFLWVGRMEYRKGLYLLLDVLHMLPLNKQWSVILCGDGTERERLQKDFCKTSFAERIEFLGKISHSMINQIYQKASVFVFPSLRETTGTVLLEAMSNGLPVICLNHGGAANLIAKECGFLIPVDSKNDCLEMFAKAMEYFIDNPEQTVAMGQNARKYVLENYSWEKKVREMNEVYVDTVNNHISLA